ncbi:acetate--CoA ligase [Allofrancisella guangzhouensis]|uniref:Acetate--CoA ligase n=1 Tax=Allofrancisella guangzhouensis TaxID=594679 RepID=A0A0A8E4K5_9GAMM|nr:acetate--CoA ligase [Allofrancisella guangzhouensis]AJC48953.1 acetyl-CoA synthetase [Allofrancisella guangzhouensis]MBK2027081.1 acetate--CoA ligase [Allofrancisella guangzhouensis]MBK2044196.1 acetate--CoA ligase [Allofrancisella guangzhouensis]MBK2045681.1 acetate--CoA ligase [Allofrancisella guangzhouensis]
MSYSKFQVSQEFIEKSHVNSAIYEQQYEESLNSSEEFWSKQAKRLYWHKPFDKAYNSTFDPVDIKWFERGKLNVCYNCVDRHLKDKADKIAFIWQADNPDKSKKITYNELYHNVCEMANVLEANGVKRGEIVTIYMPLIPESIYAMLACARIGAIHSVVFGGFSSEALRQRIINAKSNFIITADESVRSGKRIPMKASVDKAIADLDFVKNVLVIRNTNTANITWNDKIDLCYSDECKKVSKEHKIEAFDSESPLFMLYTSGSTGAPKGLIHTSGGYLVYASFTHKVVFDYKEDDIYWCTADIGWITGHTYVVYGPLANGATSVIFEGVPTYPDASRLWQEVDQHKVSILYTAPTLIRSLIKVGDDYLKGTSRESLRVLGSVGEPINPEAWEWFVEKGGNNQAPLVDTWWQTETGGIMITPLPGTHKLKAGSATKPFFGVEVALLDPNGKEIVGEGKGALCIKRATPGMARTIYNDHDRYIQSYFSSFRGYYFSGDAARRDKDGYIWIEGRMDDVINVSGHRMATAEIEAALNTHKDVAESAVVGMPHEIKGEAIYVYCILKDNIVYNEQTLTDIRKSLVAYVRQQIGPIATPEVIQFTPELPKTRSGKIMRRILRKIAARNYDNLGDTSTLVNPSIVEYLIKNK